MGRPQKNIVTNFKDRAKEVADYLVEKELINRITYKGYGKK